MRIHHVLRVCLLLVVGTAMANPPTATIDALADGIGLPAPGPIFIADDEDIDGASRTHDDLKTAAGQADVPRRAQWAAAWLCAERGDFACALTHWHALAQSAPNPPRWLPEAYALALWGLGRHEQAVAWYDTAVLGHGQLGFASALRKRYPEALFDSTALALFEQWHRQLAPLRKNVIAAVDIDSAGQVERVQVLDDQLSPVMVQRVQQAIAGWQFTPADNKGKPARRSTHVYVEVRGRPDDAQRIALDVRFMAVGVLAVRKIGPAYPVRALVHGKQGTAMVAVDINAAGNVTQARLNQSSGMQVFDKAAVAAARRWRFRMDRVDGEPVASTVILPFVFMLGVDADASAGNDGI